MGPFLAYDADGAWQEAQIVRRTAALPAISRTMGLAGSNVYRRITLHLPFVRVMFTLDRYGRGGPAGETSNQAKGGAMTQGSDRQHDEMTW